MKLRIIENNKLKWLVLFLALALLLGACGGDDEPTVQSAVESQSTATQSDETTDNNTSAVSAESPLAQLPEAVDGQISLPVIEGLQGGLLYSQGYYGGAGSQLSTLYFLGLGESEPYLIAEEVNPTTVAVSPDRKKVFYTTSGPRNRRLFVADLATFEIFELGRMQGIVAFNVGWTDDSVIYTEIRGPNAGGDLFLAKYDGSQIIDLTPEGPLSGVLSDGTLLLNGLSDDQTTLILNHYDPATGTSTELGSVAIDSENFGGVIIDVIDRVQAMGLAYSNNTFSNTSLQIGEDVYLAQLAEQVPGGVAVCGLWEVSKAGLPESTTIYSVDDATLLSGLQALPDGSFLMLHWWFEDCEINQLRNDIVRILPDGQSSVVLNGVDPGTEVNLSFLAGSSGWKFDVASDGRYLFWLGGGLQAGFSTINVTDLQTNSTVTLMRQTLLGSANDFLESQIFSNVLWIPAE